MENRVRELEEKVAELELRTTTKLSFYKESIWIWAAITLLALGSLIGTFR